MVLSEPTDEGRRRFPADPAYAALIDRVAAALPEAFGHLDSRAILVVAGAARLEARASVRPMTFGGAPPRWVSGAQQKPRVTRGGHPILYELCLRPRFYRRTDPHERLRVFLHELWHLSPRFDGTLDEGRRHRRAGPGDPAALTTFIDRLSLADPDLEVLRWRGELLVPAWLSRPPSRAPVERVLRPYGDEDLYSAIVAQI